VRFDDGRLGGGARVTDDGLRGTHGGNGNGNSAADRAS
jgi:hypothetical protein